MWLQLACFGVGLAVQMTLPQIGSTIAIVFGRLIGSIGARAMVVSHVNDSYFLGYSPSQFTVREAYQGFTVVIFLQRITALVFILVSFYLFCQSLVTL